MRPIGSSRCEPCVFLVLPAPRRCPVDQFHCPACTTSRSSGPVKFDAVNWVSRRCVFGSLWMLDLTGNKGIAICWVRILKTERLLLRPPMKSDLKPWGALLADPVASQFIGGPQDLSGAWRNLALMIGAWIIGGFSNFSAIEKSSGRWIGRAEPWQPECWPDPEIGWAFDRSAWGRGYATEAVSKCMDWAFEQLGWPEVVHLIDPANSASIALARRLGSKRLGQTKLPAPIDNTVEVYGQSRSEWRARYEGGPFVRT